MDQSSPSKPLNINLALCIDSDAIFRFRPVLMHLVVGAVDEAIRVTLISDDPRVEKLELGPTRTIKHAPLKWPFVQQRLDGLVHSLQGSPPTIAHAVTGNTYRVAWAISEAYDTDLIVNVSSARDGERLLDLDTSRVQRFVAMSEPLARLLSEQLRINEERIEIIRPGVRTVEKPHSFKNEARTPTLLCTSSFDRRDGIPAVIEAMRQLVGQGRKVLLFMLGEGRHESRLRQLVREWDLHACITFAHPLGDYAEAMGSADIFLSPCVESAVSIDTLRAMGSGLTVVATSNPVADYLIDGQTAVLFKADHASSLAAVLARLMDDTVEAQRVAASALAYVKERHPASGMAERFTSLYRRLALSRATFSIKE